MTTAICPPAWLQRNAIYQINLRTFSKGGTLSAIRAELPFLNKLGFGILYLCPVFHADTTADKATWSKRQLASGTENPKNPYRIADYFAIDEEYGTMADLKALIEDAHNLGMRILLDLVYYHMGPGAPILQAHPEYVKKNADGSFHVNEYNFPELDFSCAGLREYLLNNMLYYVDLGADGFRLDVGDAIPADFWQEARWRIHAVKPDAVLINEGSLFDLTATVFDACYCFKWHKLLRKIYCKGEAADQLGQFHKELAAKIPAGAWLIRDMENHDTVTDWAQRTELLLGHDGMEQLQVINYLIDGSPMVYCGNELACTAKLSMFANRFHPGIYETTDRSQKQTPQSLRRQEVYITLNKLKAESDILCFGKTVWHDAPDGVLAFARKLEHQEIAFWGNAQNQDIALDVPQKDVFLSNGAEFMGEKLHLKPYGYAVFA